MNGIIVINKPLGKTSHDMVYFVRRLTGIKKVGHTGTLDSFASGLLVVCVGPLTRLASRITEFDKTYEAIIKGKDIPEPGLPESFKVLKHELQALAIDVKMLDAQGNEIILSETGDDEESTTVEETVIETEGLTIKDAESEEEIQEAAVVGFGGEDEE